MKNKVTIGDLKLNSPFWVVEKKTGYGKPELVAYNITGIRFVITALEVKGENKKGLYKSIVSTRFNNRTEALGLTSIKKPLDDKIVDEVFFNYQDAKTAYHEACEKRFEEITKLRNSYTSSPKQLYKEGEAKVFGDIGFDDDIILHGEGYCYKTKPIGIYKIDSTTVEIKFINDAGGRVAKTIGKKVHTVRDGNKHLSTTYGFDITSKERSLASLNREYFKLKKIVNKK